MIFWIVIIQCIFLTFSSRIILHLALLGFSALCFLIEGQESRYNTCQLKFFFFPNTWFSLMLKVSVCDSNLPNFAKCRRYSEVPSTLILSKSIFLKLFSPYSLQYTPFPVIWQDQRKRV